MRRGEIYFVKMPEQRVRQHSCEWGHRPVVIVSSDVGVKTSPVIMACPITTKLKTLSCNVEIEWSADGRPSQVLCNQIVTLPRDEFRYCRGMLSETEMLKVNKAMLISLGIKEIWHDS